MLPAALAKQRLSKGKKRFPQAVEPYVLPIFKVLCHIPGEIVQLLGNGSPVIPGGIISFPLPGGQRDAGSTPQSNQQNHIGAQHRDHGAEQNEFQHRGENIHKPHGKTHRPRIVALRSRLGPLVQHLHLRVIVQVEIPFKIVFLQIILHPHHNIQFRRILLVL